MGVGVSTWKAMLGATRNVGYGGKFAACEQDQAKRKNEGEDQAKLNQSVDKIGQEPLPDAGQLKLQLDMVRGLNRESKMVLFHRISPDMIV